MVSTRSSSIKVNSEKRVALGTTQPKAGDGGSNRRTIVKYKKPKSPETQLVPEPSKSVSNSRKVNLQTVVIEVERLPSKLVNGHKKIKCIRDGDYNVIKTVDESGTEKVLFYYKENPRLCCPVCGTILSKSESLKEKHMYHHLTHNYKCLKPGCGVETLSPDKMAIHFSREHLDVQFEDRHKYFKIVKLTTDPKLQSWTDAVKFFSQE